MFQKKKQARATRRLQNGGRLWHVISSHYNLNHFEYIRHVKPLLLYYSTVPRTFQMNSPPSQCNYVQRGASTCIHSSSDHSMQQTPRGKLHILSPLYINSKREQCDILNCKIVLFWRCRLLLFSLTTNRSIFSDRNRGRIKCLRNFQFTPVAFEFLCLHCYALMYALPVSH